MSLRGTQVHVNRVSTKARALNVERERDRERHGGTKRDAEAQIEVARATMHPALRDDLAGKTRRFFYVTSSDATGLRSFCVRAIRTKANPKVF